MNELIIPPEDWLFEPKLGFEKMDDGGGGLVDGVVGPAGPDGDCIPCGSLVCEPAGALAPVQPNTKILNNYSASITDNHNTKIPSLSSPLCCGRQFCGVKKRAWRGMSDITLHEGNGVAEVSEATSAGRVGGWLAG